MAITSSSSRSSRSSRSDTLSQRHHHQQLSHLFNLQVLNHQNMTQAYLRGRMVQDKFNIFRILTGILTQYALMMLHDEINDSIYEKHHLCRHGEDDYTSDDSDGDDEDEDEDEESEMSLEVEERPLDPSEEEKREGLFQKLQRQTIWAERQIEAEKKRRQAQAIAFAHERSVAANICTKHVSPPAAKSKRIAPTPIHRKAVIPPTGNRKPTVAGAKARESKPEINARQPFQQTSQTLARNIRHWRRSIG